jgi:hypothetical protein
LLKEPIAQFPRRSFNPRMLMRSQFRCIAALAIKFQPVGAGQACDERLIRFGFNSAQFVIEMNDGEDEAEFVAKFEKQSQERDRIDPAGNRNADTVAGMENVFAAGVALHAFG